MTVPIVRQRAKHNKTRTGCRTCRARHIKCDETRPMCLRCTKSKRDCGGFEVSLSTPLTCSIRPKHDQNGALKICRTPSLVPWNMTSLETHAFDYFRLHTVYDLPGTSRTLCWDRLTLAAGYQEPAVTHAILALAAMDRFNAESSIVTADSPCPDSSHYEFALRQYTLAAAELQAYIRRLPRDGCVDSSIEIVLLLSLLFFCLDVLQAEDAGACAHLRNGARILYDHIGDKQYDAQINVSSIGEQESDPDRASKSHTIEIRSTPEKTIDVLARTFWRLDNDMCVAVYDYPFLRARGDALPKAFASYEQALFHVDLLYVKVQHLIELLESASRAELRQYLGLDSMDRSLRNLHVRVSSRTVPISPQLEDRIEKLRKEVLAWMSTFAELPWTPEEEAMHILTSINCYLAWTTLNHLRSPTEMAYDTCVLEGSHILTLCERYIELLSQDMGTSVEREGNSTRACLTVGTNIPGTICEIGSRCRSTSIRRRCIALLRSLNLRGTMDAEYVATILEHLTSLEETAARSISGHVEVTDLEPEDIPLEARIIDSEISVEYVRGVTKHNFYKMDWGRMIYAVSAGDNGEYEVRESLFAVERKGTYSGPATVAASQPCSNMATPLVFDDDLLLEPLMSDVEQIGLDVVEEGACGTFRK